MLPSPATSTRTVTTCLPQSGRNALHSGCWTWSTPAGRSMPQPYHLSSRARKYLGTRENSLRLVSHWYYSAHMETSHMSDAAEALFGSQTISPHGGPLYLQLKRGIEEAVRRGAIKPGDALPSERDLAARVEISRVTV